LAAETLAAEPALLRSPASQRRLGVPWRLRKALRPLARDPSAAPPCPVRVMRFDFHPAADGWRVSEVNSDVPGGFAEASAFTPLLAAHFPRYGTPGDVAGAWAAALARQVDRDAGPVALLAASGFMEDRQVVAYLARRLSELGVATRTADPSQLRWRGGRAIVGEAATPEIPSGSSPGAPSPACRLPRATGPGAAAAAVVRFYQGEWLTRLPARCGWQLLLAGGRTPVANPPAAILTESKRFPLAWDDLPTPLHAWRGLLPETRDPRDAPWRTDDAGLLKSAYCNTGDTVAIRGVSPPARWRAAGRAARWSPRQWVAQRRFDTLAVDGPSYSVYPCVGVYTVDGRAAGAYARFSRTPVVDFEAVDAALLIDPAEGLE
jgi:hypothetical protein